MAKQIMQFRYYGDDNNDKTGNNYPEDLTASQLNDGSAFKDIASITQLGIQSLPGTRFYLNDESGFTPPIIIGSTGIYELELEGISAITSLWFEGASLATISNNPNAYLIIDMICELRQED